MPGQPIRTKAKAGAQPVRAWLLLILLILLPVTVALAAPEPVDSSAVDTVQQEAGLHTQGPSDTPVCHHVGHHGKVSALISDKRDAELPTPADNVAALPSQGPAQHPLAVAEGPLHTPPSDNLRPTLPLYLRTQRLRV